MKDIRRFKPDIVHTELFGAAGLFAWVSARALGVPLVGTDHTFPADYLYGLHFPPFPYLAKKYAAVFYQRCDFVTGPSQNILQQLRDYGFTKPSRVVSNPIASDFRGLPNKAELKQKFGIHERAILVFGRIAAEKNLDVAFDVFAGVARRSDAQLVFLGDGPYRATLEARAQSAQLSARVKFLGMLRNGALVEAINACDVLLITSTSENQPMTLLQAFACGLPAVVARAGGLPEYVEDGVSGYVVPPTDKTGFVDRVLSLVTDRALAEKLGNAGRVSVEQYRPESIANQFVEVYQAAIAANLTG